MSWLARRLGFYLLAGWAAVSLNFVIPRLMPGDPATVMFARFRGELPPESIAALRRTFGLSDAPLWRQYLDYLASAARGDLGISVSHFPAPVVEVIAGGLGWTLLLAGGAVIIAFGLGTALGALAAWRRGGWLDAVAPPALALLGSFPFFWLAMAVSYVFAYEYGWFPIRGAYDSGLTPGLSLAFIGSVAAHAALPAATMVAASLGGWLLAMRSAMIGVLGEDYIGYAAARGLPPGRVLVHYAARNAVLPSLTGFGMALGFVVSGALLTEIVFSYPGQGYLLLQAVRARDYPLMQGLFLSITAAVLGANALVDVAVALLDPRTRAP